MLDYPPGLMRGAEEAMRLLRSKAQEHRLPPEAARSMSLPGSLQTEPPAHTVRLRQTHLRLRTQRRSGMNTGCPKPPGLGSLPLGGNHSTQVCLGLPGPTDSPAEH